MGSFISRNGAGNRASEFLVTILLESAEGFRVLGLGFRAPIIIPS